MGRTVRTISRAAKISAAPYVHVLCRLGVIRACILLVSPAMFDLELLLNRVRGEYREMPGLRLSAKQACRLWHIDSTTCHELLSRLVSERFLFRTHGGAYIAVPSARPAPAKAALSTSHSRTLRRRRA